jgi:hypothetical protein
MHALLLGLAHAKTRAGGVLDVADMVAAVVMAADAVAVAVAAMDAEDMALVDVIRIKAS